MLNSINPPPHKTRLSPQIFFCLDYNFSSSLTFYLPNNEDFLRLVDYENAMIIHLSIMQKIRG